jgi:hypothetical protein
MLVAGDLLCSRVTRGGRVEDSGDKAHEVDANCARKISVAAITQTKDGDEKAVRNIRRSIEPNKTMPLVFD